MGGVKSQDAHPCHPPRSVPWTASLALLSVVGVMVGVGLLSSLIVLRPAGSHLPMEVTSGSTLAGTFTRNARSAAAVLGAGWTSWVLRRCAGGVERGKFDRDFADAPVKTEQSLRLVCQGAPS